MGEEEEEEGRGFLGWVRGREVGGFFSFLEGGSELVFAEERRRGNTKKEDYRKNLGRVRNGSGPPRTILVPNWSQSRNFKNSIPNS